MGIIYLQVSSGPPSETPARFPSPQANIAPTIKIGRTTAPLLGRPAGPTPPVPVGPVVPVEALDEVVGLPEPL